MTEQALSAKEWYDQASVEQLKAYIDALQEAVEYSDCGCGASYAFSEHPLTVIEKYGGRRD